MNKSKEKIVQFLNEAVIESTLEYYQSTYSTFRDTNKEFVECQKLMGNKIDQVYYLGFFSRVHPLI
jgi:hypothetical protein